MLVFVFAMVTLSNSAPDPAVTAAPSLAGRLSGGASADGLQTGAGGFGDLTISAGCTYGSPRFGTAAVADANALARTVTEPTCTPDPAEAFDQAPAFGPLAGPFLRPAFLLPAVSPGGPVSLQTAAGSGFSGASTFAAVPVTRTYLLQHLTLPTEFNVPLAGPIVVRSAGTPAAARSVPATVRKPATTH